VTGQKALETRWAEVKREEEVTKTALSEAKKEQESTERRLNTEMEELDGLKMATFDIERRGTAAEKKIAELENEKRKLDEEIRKKEEEIEQFEKQMEECVVPDDIDWRLKAAIEAAHEVLCLSLIVLTCGHDEPWRLHGIDAVPVRRSPSRSKRCRMPRCSTKGKCKTVKETLKTSNEESSSLKILGHERSALCRTGTDSCSRHTSSSRAILAVFGRMFTVPLCWRSTCAATNTTRYAWTCSPADAHESESMLRRHTSSIVWVSKFLKALSFRYLPSDRAFLRRFGPPDRCLDFRTKTTSSCSTT
jgi:hypothetical protein